MTTSDPNAANAKQEEPKDPAQIDYQQGVEFLSNHSYGQAANAFHNALVGFELNGNEEGIANAKDKLGDVCLAQEEYTKAASYYQEVFGICKKFDDLMSLLALRKKLVQCYRGLKDYDKAIEIYLEMLHFYEAMNNPGSTVETMINIAETYEEKGDTANAADAYETAAGIHANFNHKLQAEKLLDKARELREIQ